ncbi:hypothetical protein AGMMS49975_20690 [Clostridia bacterium]|nr:hypothetical protein AGMMS49975_20690 [Clostridia bacterium]
MITRVDNPYVLTEVEVDEKFDGKWVLLSLKGFRSSAGRGYVEAIGTEQNDVTEMAWIAHNEFDGNALLKHGYKDRGKTWFIKP